MNVPFIKTTRFLLALVFLTLPLMASASTLERVRSSHSFTMGYLPDLAPFSTQEATKPAAMPSSSALKLQTSSSANLACRTCKCATSRLRFTSRSVR